MTSFWLLQRSWYFATVISSLMPFICIAPSPTSAITGRSGFVNFAATAHGTPGPIVASVPASAIHGRVVVRELRRDRVRDARAQRRERPRDRRHHPRPQLQVAREPVRR